MITPTEATASYRPEQAAVLDFVLTALVELQLLSNRELSERHINFGTRDRVVTLTEVTETEGERVRVRDCRRNARRGVCCRLVDRPNV